MASLLLLQFVLNALKYQELIVDATSKRALVTAENIESAIFRAEQVGLNIDEVANLDPLIDRELSRSTVLEDIRVLGPTGTQIAGSDLHPLDLATKDLLMRRVQSRDEPVYTQEIDGRLYTTLKVYDSGSSMMGVILLSTDRATYATNIRRSTVQLGGGFLILFVVLSLLVIPFVVYGFRRVGTLISEIEKGLRRKETAPEPSDDPEIEALRAVIQQGNEAYDEVAERVRHAEQDLARN